MVEALNQEHVLIGQLPAYVREMAPYRPGKPIEELKEEYGFDKVIKLASNENPFGASPNALMAVQQGLQETFRYPDPVSRRLRRKIAQSLGIDAREIVVGAGSESLLATTVRSVMKPGDHALAPEGAFMGFAIHLSAHGGLLKTVSAPNYRFDLDRVAQAVTPETKIIYLPNPNNPTGTFFTHQELEHFLAQVPRSTLVLLDEAYIEFAEGFPAYPKALTLRQENLLILRTFSKAYGLAGFRIGYGIGHPLLIEQLAKVKMTFEPSLPAQLAAEAAWDDAAFIQKTVANNAQELERYYQVFEELKLPYVPSAGNFVFVECPSSDYVNALNEALLRSGIAIRPLTSFGFPSCIRISIGLPEENDALFAALRAILPTL